MDQREFEELSDLLPAVQRAAERLGPESEWGGACGEFAKALGRSLDRRLPAEQPLSLASRQPQ